LAYAIKFINLSILGKLKFTKAPAVGTMLLSGIMLKMGLYSVIRWQLPIAAVAAKTYTQYFRPWYCWGNLRIYSRLKTKDLKFISYSSLAHVGLIAAGTYTLTLDGLRGAVYK
jgi:NADH-quinone oxidoreductase subunit M